MNLLRRPRVQAAVVALLGGLVVFALSHLVFPYHTSNHDEAVYLQQAAMLLEGQLFLRPPVEDVFRPWFFVESERGLYPKYTPVPAAMFAAGKLLGGYRITLGVVAAGVLVGTYHTVRETFDARTGVVATVLTLASPLFLVDASVFLSYVPATFWNLGFAASYLHADRTGNRPTAAIAGACVGVAFFTRPYTAVLFATPFVCHALWSCRTLRRPVVERVGLTAAFGLGGVMLAVTYNTLTTGDPFVFPYQAFAPNDGLGFGERSILGYSREFTPALSLAANGELLWTFATRWLVAGPLGTLAAAVGVVAVSRRGFDARQLALGGVFLTVPLGNLYFWGTVNMLGSLSDPTDGLVRFLGPFYHVDLLVPAVAFGAVGVLWAADRLRTLVEVRVPSQHVRPVLLAVALVCATVGGAAAVTTAAEPLRDNHTVTQQYERAYAPFEDRDLSNGVVFLPTPHGDWLNHPFQYLRNGPEFDGETVYAMQNRQFAVVDSYPDRRYYRYDYRGEWEPYRGQAVEPKIQRVRLVEAGTVVTTVDAAAPAPARLASVRLTNGDWSVTAAVDGTDPLSLRLVTDAQSTRVRGAELNETVAVPTPDRGTVTLVAFVDYGTGAGYEYRVELPVDRETDEVRTLTPRLEVCWTEQRCEGRAAHVPDSYQYDIDLNVTVSATADPSRD
ncbi:glycosyltransferase family 39 protein [Halomicroarcula sp. F13]|uniref:Glycosyltransferase family 39 protein n=1 Tax=Haloarcula rubra TaxID=2487747 RepID=A0AAW4PQ18_9EURY|nr:glycosyltransferase family 39 protein [Halomicroarcula rubra]MBX0323271.1 glycosyltransferase family 39 protein [Halomicroarcula rubra]